MRLQERERYARVAAVSLAIDQCILPLPAWQESAHLRRTLLLQKSPYGSQKREIRNPMIVPRWYHLASNWHEYKST